MRLIFHLNFIGYPVSSTVCLFVCFDFSSHTRIFHSYGDVIITGEGQILTYARHLWPLSSEGSLACGSYIDMDHPFIMLISENLTLTHIAGPLAVELSLPVLTAWDSNIQHSACGANALTDCATTATSKFQLLVPNFNTALNLR